MNKKLSFILLLICVIVSLFLVYKWIFDKEDMQSGLVIQLILWPLLAVVWDLKWKRTNMSK
ncbi:hypothetical protein CMU78_09430 [Elizabethkingia anophelis]|uniref:Uncharacterized protein n=1 Tax=Elizabethkingia anophelis TaxID=1117645 RepID=A0AAE4NYD9_9FLAO|nr:hypothetical protein AYC67_01960 [Elizabethkingia anophelis]MDV3460268.1 hypothetical protein [Elizabethkingia anophelis]MDV3628494.1 hypothetical protein [Elizabethkingia anophelis]MDV3664215.1 hypothetical protein [Elizabethkingia anophelis]MDV3777097.1 hypothetical protein [Elizabethkingia anophelis]